MLPLALMKEGEVVRVIRINGNDTSKKHLKDLGFVDGAVVNIISSHDGDIILNIKDSRLAITKDMADKIMIDVASEKDLRRGSFENIA